MRTIVRIYVLFYILAFGSVIIAQEALLHPMYTLDLAPLLPRGPEVFLTGALTFLTNHTLAVSLCSNAGCNLETLDLAGGEVRTLARTSKYENYRDLFRTPEGGVVLDHVLTGSRQGGAVLFDSDLRTPQLMQPANICGWCMSTTGKTFVQQLSRNDWAAYQVAVQPVQLCSGTGRVLSVSDDAVVYFDQGTVRIQRMDGKSVGTFAVGHTSGATPVVRFLGRDRLLFDSGSQPEIRDFNGKTLRKLEREDGWGFRMGQSSDGSRLLYDRYTRHIPLAQTIKENAIAVATMGMGVGDEEANGEMVRVIDTNSGKQCFEWDGRNGVLLAGGFHADINPTGEFVAIMTRTSLAIYRLPDVCATM